MCIFLAIKIFYLYLKYLSNLNFTIYSNNCELINNSTNKCFFDLDMLITIIN